MRLKTKASSVYWRNLKREQRRKAREQGNCSICTSKPAKPGFATCEGCLENRRKRGRKAASR